MKKTFVLLALCVVCALSACSGGDTPSSESVKPTNPNQTEYTGTQRGNYLNSGYVVAGDGRVYFCDPEVWNMWSMKHDGSDVQSIDQSSRAYRLNYKAGSLYFVSYVDSFTYSMKPDGSNKLLLSEEEIYPIFIGEHILSLQSGDDHIDAFSSDWSNPTELYNSTTDGDSRKLWNATVGTDRVFYIARDNPPVVSTLYSMALDGSDRLALLAYEEGILFGGMVWHDGMLYYRHIRSDDNGETVSLRRCAEDGSIDEEVVASFDGYYNIDGDYLFYGSETGFMRHTLATGEEQPVDMGASLRMIDICDGWLYYTVSASTAQNGAKKQPYIGRVQPDGSDHQIFVPSEASWNKAHDVLAVRNAGDSLPYIVEGSLGSIVKADYYQAFAQYLLDVNAVEQLAEKPTFTNSDTYFEIGTAGVLDLSQPSSIVVAIFTFIPSEEYQAYFEAALACSGLEHGDITAIMDYINTGAAFGFTDTYTAANGMTYTTGKNASFILLIIEE